MKNAKWNQSMIEMGNNNFYIEEKGSKNDNY